MISKPMLFSAPMVRAILEGRKTQTRRIMKLPEVYPHGPITPDRQLKIGYCYYTGTWQWQDEYGNCNCNKKGPHAIRTPHSAGSEIWVRETWQHAPQEYCSCSQPSEAAPCDDWWEGTGCRSNRGRVIFAADKQAVHGQSLRWRPSIFMPRWASRITLTVESVRAERLQDISESDAKAEGCEHPEFRTAVMRPDGGPDYHIPVSFRGAYANLWNEINGSGAWELNPWVWRYEFPKYTDTLEATR